MNLNNKQKYKLSVTVLVLLLIPIYTLSIFFHEVGHALAAIASGGHVIEFYVGWFDGYVLSAKPADAVFLVKLMGGVFQAFFFCILSVRNKAFSIPMIGSLMYAVGEAMRFANNDMVILKYIVFAGVVVALIWGMNLAYTKYMINEE